MATVSFSLHLSLNVPARGHCPLLSIVLIPNIFMAHQICTSADLHPLIPLLNQLPGRALRVAGRHYSRSHQLRLQQAFYRAPHMGMHD